MRKFKFYRKDGQCIVVLGRSPIHAWEELCEQLEDDYFYLKAFLDANKNKGATIKGYGWLNKAIDREFSDDFGPVFVEL